MSGMTTPRPEWKKIESAPKDDLLLLLCRYDPSDDCGCALEDIGEDQYGRTIGFLGEEGWHIVGWDWCQDYYLDARGAMPMYWQPFPLPLPDPPKESAE